MRKRPSPLVPRDPPQGRVKFVCDSAVGEGEGGSFYPPSGRVAEEERRRGEGDTAIVRRAEWSAMDGAKREGPPRSFLATLPRGG
jgi:hypothetical protein